MTERTLFDDVDEPRTPPPLPGARTPTRTAIARPTDPQTSRDAARSLTPETMSVSQRAVQALMGRVGPSTLEQFVTAYRSHHEQSPQVYPRQSDSGLRTRVSELVDAGWITDTGATRSTTSGRRAIVWATVRTRPTVDPPGA